MEESGNSALRIAMGVIITVFVCTMGFGLYMLSKSTTSSAQKQVNKLSNQMAESEYTQYEGVEVTGTEVVNVIKQFQ